MLSPKLGNVPSFNKKMLNANQTCKRCKLHAFSRTVCCEGSGTGKSGIMLVGEALGEREEECGRAFVGDAGYKLNYILHRAGLKRKELRIENAVRCRPPKNKKPSKKEVEACWPYLLLAILEFKPKVIVAMGATAKDALIWDPSKKKNSRVDKARGFYERRTFRVVDTEDNDNYLEHTCYVIPTYHPAACLRAWELDDLMVYDLILAKELTSGREPLKWPDTEVKVLKGRDEAVDFIVGLRRKCGFVIDLETTSLNPHNSEVMCIGFCFKKGSAVILPLLSQNKLQYWSSIDKKLILGELVLTLQESALYGQNLKFDIQHLRKLIGIWPYKIGFDTMLAHYVIDENKPHNLTFLCQWYLGWMRYDALTDQYKTDKQFKTWEMPDELLWKYCGYDVDGCFRLKQLFSKMIKDEGLDKVYKVEEGLILPIADMEFRGVHIDTKRIVELADTYRKDVRKTVKLVRRIANRTLGEEEGEKFNYNSSQQLGSILKKMGAHLSKKTAGGKASVNKFVLRSLMMGKDRPATLSRAVLTIRKLERFITVYLDGVSPEENKKSKGGFLQWVQEYDRIHTNYNLTKTRTGRLSADDPPLQTAPRTGGIRSILVPDVPGRDVLVSADYAKLELCIMAWLSNDTVMIKELLSGADLHTSMAVTARLMRMPTQEELDKISPLVGQDERTIAKGVNFGVPYGRGSGAIADANPEAFPITMPRVERVAKVQVILNAYFAKYWKIAEFREKQISEALCKMELITNTHNRVRRLHGVDWFTSKWGEQTARYDIDFSHIKREALNCKIQSIGSDFLSEATARCYIGIEKVRIPALRMVMSLHDALIFNVNKKYVEESIKYIKQWMETELPKDKEHKYAMPIKVDCKVENYWGESSK